MTSTTSGRSKPPFRSASPLSRTKIEEYHSEEDQCEVEGFAAEVLFLEDQGMTIYQLLQMIYKEYGYRKEGLTSLVGKGKSGTKPKIKFYFGA
mgnify:CR=1 FL=1